MAEQEWWILRARASGDSGSNTKRSVEAGATEKGPRPAPRLPTSGSSLLSLPHRLPLYPLTPISPCLQPNQPILILSHLRTSYLLRHRIFSWSDLALNFSPDKTKYHFSIHFTISLLHILNNNIKHWVNIIPKSPYEKKTVLIPYLSFL